MPLDTTAAGSGPEEKRISEKQFLRAWRDLLTNDREIQETKEAAAGARGIKAGIIKRLEGFGYPKQALKIFSLLYELEEGERLSVIDAITQAGIWTKTQLWRPGDNDRPQGVLFGNLAEAPDPELAQERVETAETLIKTDAWNTAKAGGEASDNPHQVGTREHQVWATEFHRYHVAHEGNAEQQKAAGRKRRAAAAPKPNGKDRSEAAKGARATRGRPRKPAPGDEQPAA